MRITIRTLPCVKGEEIPLKTYPLFAPPGQDQESFQTITSVLLSAHISESKPEPSEFPPGSLLESASGAAFMILGYEWLLVPGDGDVVHSIFAPILRALTDMPESLEEPFSLRREGWSLAVVTLSDKGWRGEREDGAGPAVAALVAASLPLSLTRFFLVPDDRGKLKALLARLALEECYNLILTSGGTGLSERDITPETTLSLLDKTLPGFSFAMTQASLAITPRAIISRAVAGIIGRCLVINLPGSEKAARENLAAILPGLDHALEKLNGDQTDCGA
ncbi:MAG: MogA/MoaB family molybdenum cofactor biosynthesis protein [Desulfovibrio sp.]|nr:MogA/MoaB family molybdenum cofactor biosynthesis protein [Desulfovibrio sp.]